MDDISRTYIRVHDGMADHPKIAPLSDAAFRLLLETWMWCSRQHTDGYIRRDMWKLRGKPAVRRELEREMIEQVDGDLLRCHDYLDWQRSRAEAEAAAGANRTGRARSSVHANHARWHVGSNGRPNPEGCELCPADEAPPDDDPGPVPDSVGIPDRSPIGVPTDSYPDPDRSPNGVPTGAGRESCGSPAGSHRDRDRDRRESTGGGTVTKVDARKIANGAHAPPPAPPFDLANPRCRAHRSVPADDPGPPCRVCRDLRLRAEQATASVAAEVPDHRAAIAACDRCDDNGMIEIGDDGRPARCRHPPPAAPPLTSPEPEMSPA